MALQLGKNTLLGLPMILGLAHAFKTTSYAYPIKKTITMKRIPGILMPPLMALWKGALNLVFGHQ
jgi:hypothetical protein